MVERIGFAVFYKNKKVIDQIKDLVNITYISTTKKYVYAYCDAKRFEGLKKTISASKDVIAVEKTLLDMDHLGFDQIFKPVK